MKHRIANRNLPQLFLKARANLMCHFRPIISKFGLTDQQWRILRVLDLQGQAEPRDLCELCQISSPSMTGVLKRMEELNLIQRSAVAGDQRRVMIGFSEHGNALMAEMAPLIDAQYRHIEEAYGLSAIENLIMALEQFNQVREEDVRHIL